MGFNLLRRLAEYVYPKSCKTSEIDDDYLSTVPLLRDSEDLMPEPNGCALDITETEAEKLERIARSDSE